MPPPNRASSLKRGKSKISLVDYPLTNINLIISGQCYECDSDSGSDIMRVRVIVIVRVIVMMVRGEVECQG